MIKIGELYRRDGVWNGHQIVPADWIQQSTAPSTLNPDYGLFWWILGEPEGPGYTAAGTGEQHITVLPTSRAVIVYLSDVQPNSEITAEDVKTPQRRVRRCLSVTTGHRRNVRGHPGGTGQVGGPKWTEPLTSALSGRFKPIQADSGRFRPIQADSGLQSMPRDDSE